MGALYVKKHFKEDAKQSALEMVADIRAEFDQILKEIDWMDHGTKARYSIYKIVKTWDKLKIWKYPWLRS